MKTVVRLLFLLAGLCLLTGCVGVSGDGPNFEYNWVEAELDGGNPVAKCTAATLKPGTTTYGQVVAELGVPLLRFENPRVIAYAWETHSGAYSHCIPPWDPTIYPLHLRVRAFALVFDDQPILQRYAYFSETDSQTLRQHILAWANTAPAVP